MTRRATRLLATAAVLAASLALTATGAAASPRAYAVGDSVMLGAKAQLEKRGVRVDAAVSRQLDDGTAILRALRPRPRAVVVHLGTNGPIARSDLDALLRALRGVQRVVLVTVHVDRSWEAGNNSVIRAAARRYANAELLDWSWFGRRHPGWFWDDGYHLRPGGAAAYARLVAGKL